MDLIALRHFVVAAELGSLSRAAVKLGVAQSAVSRQLSALEQSLGGRVFYRTGRGVQLTETGESLLPRARALLQDAQAMVDDARQVMSQPIGRVSIGLVPAWTHPIAGRLLNWTRAHYPGIRIDILEGYSGEIEAWLTSGRIDLGVLNHYRARGQGDPVSRHRMQLVMRADDPWSARTARLKSLATLSLALPARPNSLRMMLDGLCQRASIELDVRLEANASVAIKDAVLHGGLYSVLPPQAIDQERRLGLLRGVDIVEPVIWQTSVIATTSQHPLGAAARQILRVLPTLFSEAPALQGSKRSARRRQAFTGV